MTRPSTSPAAVEVRRRRRRMLMLLWSAPVVVVALLVAGKALSVPLLTSQGSKQFGNAEYTDATATFEKLKTLNVAEKWLISFNLGTALLADGQLEEAIDALETAHGLVPAMPEDLSSVEDPHLLPACVVNTNTSVAYEMQADEVHLAADALVVEMEQAAQDLAALGDAVPSDGSAPDPEPFRLEAIDTYLKAEELYRTANTTRVRDGCLDDEVAAARNVEKETIAREKRLKLEEPPPPEGGGDEDPPPSEPPPPEGGEEPPPPPEPSDPEEEQRQKDLDKLKEDAQADENLTGDLVDPGDQYDPDVPPW